MINFVILSLTSSTYSLVLSIIEIEEYDSEDEKENMDDHNNNKHTESKESTGNITNHCRVYGPYTTNTKPNTTKSCYQLHEYNSSNERDIPKVNLNFFISLV